jgi:hypothetical protein
MTTAANGQRPPGGQSNRTTGQAGQTRVRVVGQNGGQRSRSFIGTVNFGKDGQGGQPASGRFLPNAGESSGRASAGDSLTRAVQALMSIQIHDQHDLFEFLNAAREVGHTLAIYVRMGAEELSAQMKAAERSKSAVSVLGPGAWARIRQVVRETDKSGDSFADAAKHAATAWKMFQRNFADDLSRAQTPARTSHRGFQIT